MNESVCVACVLEDVRLVLDKLRLLLLSPCCGCAAATSASSVGVRLLPTSISRSWLTFISFAFRILCSSKDVDVADRVKYESVKETCFDRVELSSVAWWCGGMAWWWWICDRGADGYRVAGCRAE
jgi:hypothetical protein